MCNKHKRQIYFAFLFFSNIISSTLIKLLPLVSGIFKNPQIVHKALMTEKQKKTPYRPRYSFNLGNIIVAIAEKL